MNGHPNSGEGSSETGALTGTMRVKAGLAQMLKSGVIMGTTLYSPGSTRLTVVPSCIFVISRHLPPYPPLEKRLPRSLGLLKSGIWIRVHGPQFSTVVTGSPAAIFRFWSLQGPCSSVSFPLIYTLPGFRFDASKGSVGVRVGIGWTSGFRCFTLSALEEKQSENNRGFLATN